MELTPGLRRLSFPVMRKHPLMKSAPGYAQKLFDEGSKLRREKLRREFKERNPERFKGKNGN